MDEKTATIRRWVIHPAILFLATGGLCVMLAVLIALCAYSVSGVKWTLNLGQALGLVTATLLIAILFSFLATVCYMLSRRNAAYREIAGHLHGINHSYRDAVAEMLWQTSETKTGTAESPDQDEETILEEERRNLTLICQKISYIFMSLTGRLCSTSVFLRVDNSDEEKTSKNSESSESAETSVFLWAVGAYKSQRNKFLFNEESISKGSVFFELDQFQNNGCDHPLPHVLSNDFRIERKTKFSKSKIFDTDDSSQPASILVVPIRWRNSDAPECIGYLSIECSSRFRLMPARAKFGNLNASEHVQFLAAFADQMFNYISLSRLNISQDEK